MTNQEIIEGIGQLDVGKLEADLKELLAKVATTRQLLALAKTRQKPGRQRAVTTRKARTPKATADNGAAVPAEA